MNQHNLMEQKIEALRAWFEGIPGTITAFSGGVDSSLVLYLSKKFLKENAYGCISKSKSLKSKDFQVASDFCRQFDIPLKVIETTELYDENYNSNPSNRCFFCKNHLYTDLSEIAEQFPGYLVLNGTNKDDYKDHRPGIKAAVKHRIKTPLADCGLTKSDVREMAQYFGLPNWDKPASPCLSSRVPYGNAISASKLQQIENAESILNDYGFDDVRVRHYDREARIEVPSSQINELKEAFSPIQNSIKALGFDYCTIDEEGMVSGKLNRTLK